MDTIGDRKSYDAFVPDVQCETGYLNVMCGNCMWGYFPAASDMCMPCLGSKDDQVLTKLFYAGLSTMTFGIFALMIFGYLVDGLYLGGPDEYYKKTHWSDTCKGRCSHRWGVFSKKLMGLGFEYEKMKIALGLFQVLSSLRGTYDLDWPPEVVEFFKQFAIFENLDLFKLVAMDCLYKTDYFFSLKAVTMMPLTMCVVLYMIWRRGNNVFRHKIAYYPRFCEKCGHPIDMYEINAKELAIRRRLKGRWCKLWRHHLHTYLYGGRYIYEDNGLDEEDSLRETKVVKFMRKSSSNAAHKEIRLPGAWAKYRKRKNRIEETKTNAGSDSSPSKKNELQKRKIKVMARDREGQTFVAYNAFVHTGTVCPEAPKIATKQTRVGNWKMRVLLRIRFQTFKSKCLQILFWILLVTYPSISRKILMLFKCVQIGYEDYMMWDTQILCYTNDWWIHAVYAIVFGCVYIIGVPGLFWYLLYKLRESHVEENAIMIHEDERLRIKTLRLAKQDTQDRGKYWRKMRTADDEMRRIKAYLRRLNLRDERNKSRLGFLYKNFKEDYYWFEMCEFIFKLLMTGAMVHIVPGTVSQILCGMVISFLGFGMHIGSKPYTKSTNNILMIASKFQLFLVLSMALLLKMEAPLFAQDSSMQEMDISFMSMMIIYTTCLLLAAFVFAMYWDYHTAQQKRRELELSRMHEKNATSRFKALKKKVAMAAVKGKPGVSGKRKAGVLATVRAEYGAKSSEYEEMVKDSIAEGRFKQHADFLKEVRQEFGPTSMEYKTLFNILQRLTEIEYEPSLRAEKPPSKAPFFNGMFAFSRTAKSKNKKKLTAVTPIQEPSSETKQANATPNKDNASKKTPQVLQAGISIDVPPLPGKKTSNPKRLSL